MSNTEQNNYNAFYYDFGGPFASGGKKQMLQYEELNLDVLLKQGKAKEVKMNNFYILWNTLGLVFCGRKKTTSYVFVEEFKCLRNNIERVKELDALRKDTNYQFVCSYPIINEKEKVKINNGTEEEPDMAEIMTTVVKEYYIVRKYELKTSYTDWNCVGTQCSEYGKLDQVSHLAWTLASSGVYDEYCVYKVPLIEEHKKCELTKYDEEEEVDEEEEEEEDEDDE